MAKTIMISNEAYEKLKYLKERANKSFTEIIIEVMLKNNIKRGSDLRDCLGIIKKDDEPKEIDKELKRGWKKWNERYA